MKPSERFETLDKYHPTPWRIVCQFVAGDYWPKEIIDANGLKVMDCEWGSATEAGKLKYAAIVEAVDDRVKYGNPWNDV